MQPWTAQEFRGRAAAGHPVSGAVFDADNCIRAETRDEWQSRIERPSLVDGASHYRKLKGVASKTVRKWGVLSTVS